MSFKCHGLRKSRRSTDHIDRVKLRHISMVAIRSPFCRSRPSYCALLSGEDLSRYSNKIESVDLRKFRISAILQRK